MIGATEQRGRADGGTTMIRIAIVIATFTLCTAAPAAEMAFYQLPSGAYPHDVAPAPDGTVWFSGQRQGFAGRFDPKNGRLEKISLGPGASPHGVIVGPDGNAWLTETGQNAIARVDAKSGAVKLFPLPADFAGANLNTPEGQGALRDHCDAGGRCLVRVPRRRPHRQNRCHNRRSHRRRSATQGGGAAPHLVGLERRAVGELLERGSDRPLRSRGESVDHLSDAAEQVRHLFDLRRRQGPGVGHRLSPTPSSASIPRPRPTPPSPATGAARTCARCWAGRARRGAGNRARIAW
jgi:hypothetical protein